MAHRFTLSELKQKSDNQILQILVNDKLGTLTNPYTQLNERLRKISAKLERTTKIYILFSCDSWKSSSSMSLVMASSDEGKIREEIIKQVEAKKMEYGSYEKDLKEMKLLELNNCLAYGHIQVVDDGERQ